MTKAIKEHYRNLGREHRKSEFSYAKALGTIWSILTADELLTKERVARALAFLEGFDLEY